MNLRINSAEANLRATPSTSQAPLARLPVGHLVLAQAAPQGAWRGCQTTVDGVTLNGFVHDSLLRPEINATVDGLVEVAGHEYRLFKFGKRHETHPDSRERIKKYWLSFASQAEPVSEPWSAAFVSFVMKKASLGKSFKFSGRHTDYMSACKDAKVAGDASCSYWSLELSDRKLQIGDVIGAYRTGKECGSEVRTYDSLPGDFCSHCDIVVAIRDGNATTVGGNVNNTVGVKTVPLTSKGHVVEGSKRITVMARNF
jgi:hypothetical protein